MKFNHSTTATDLEAFVQGWYKPQKPAKTQSVLAEQAVKNYVKEHAKVATRLCHATTGGDSRIPYTRIHPLNSPSVKRRSLVHPTTGAMPWPAREAHSTRLRICIAGYGSQQGAQAARLLGRSPAAWTTSSERGRFLLTFSIFFILVRVGETVSKSEYSKLVLITACITADFDLSANQRRGQANTDPDRSCLQPGGGYEEGPAKTHDVCSVLESSRGIGAPRNDLRSKGHVTGHGIVKKWHCVFRVCLLTLRAVRGARLASHPEYIHAQHEITIPKSPLPAVSRAASVRSFTSVTLFG